jgi:hypothetical protein
VSTFITISRSINDTFSAMLSILSDTQKAIVETITMRLHVSQSLQYLKDAGHEMSRRTYFRQKKMIEDMSLERMHHIAKVAYKEQHLQRLDKVELIEKLMWDNYHIEKDPNKKVKILETIVGMQPYISGYYDSTRYVLQEYVKSEADIRKTTCEPYMSWNIKHKRQAELKKEAEERRSNMIKEIQAVAEEAVYNNDLQTTDNSVNFASVQEDANLIESESWANVSDNDTPIEKQPIHTEEQPEEQESEVEKYWRTHNPKPKPRPKGNTVRYYTTS